MIAIDAGFLVILFFPVQVSNTTHNKENDHKIRLCAIVSFIIILPVFTVKYFLGAEASLEGPPTKRHSGQHTELGKLIT